MGLSLTALGGDLLPERTPRDAARLLAVRHAGIAAILAIAAPIAAHQLDVTTQTAKERGVALVLDAPLPPQAKIKLAPALLEGVDSDEPRAGLQRAVAAERHNFTGRDRATYDDLGQRADDMLVTAVGEAFRSSFLLAGAAGLLAAALLAPARSWRRWPRPTRADARHARGLLRAAPGDRARRRRRSRTRATPIARCPRRAA